MTEERQLQVDEVSIKVDEFLLNLLQEYKLEPLALSAIVSGRVYMFNESAGTVDEFRELLEHVLEIQPTDYITQNEQIHILSQLLILCSKSISKNPSTTRRRICSNP
jgi:hypothetical protein